MPMPTGAGKIPSFMDSERMKTPKTDCLLRFMKGEKLDSRFVDLENTGFPASLAEQSVFILSSIPKYVLQEGATPFSFCAITYTIITLHEAQRWCK